MPPERKGELAVLLSCVFFGLMALVVKTVSAAFSGMFISLFRFVVGIGLGLTLLRLSRAPFVIHRKPLWVVRGVLGATAMSVYYTAIQLTSSGRATLLINTFPIFVALFGHFLFHERLTPLKIASVGVCMVGVICVFYDGSAYSGWGDLLGLSAGVVRGLVVHFIKRLAECNHPAIVYLAACFCGLSLLPVVGGEVVNVNADAALLMLLISALAFTAQLFMTYGYGRVTALKASLLSYLAIPLTILFSAFIGEELRGRFFLGTFLIIVGLIIHTWDNLKRQPARA
jgi:drug/metabolite transporter (DMT)-like permease